VQKLLYLGSSCIYPRESVQPITEDQLLTGPLEPTNEGYALAKIAGVKLCEFYRQQYGCNFVSAMPTNLYGPGDNFDLESSHVIAAMIRKYVEARDRRDDEVVLWGTGSPSREFLYVDDAAAALILAAERLDTSEPVNIGTGVETRIRDLAELIHELTGFEGETVWDSSKPDGQPKRVLDVSRARELMGFEAQTSLREGLSKTIESFEAAARV
jgi:GDP-L-fucose synthase